MRCFWLGYTKYDVCLQLEGMKPDQEDDIHACGEGIAVPLQNIGSQRLISETPITHSIHLIYPLLKVLLYHTLSVLKHCYVAFPEKVGTNILFPYYMAPTTDQCKHSTQAQLGKPVSLLILLSGTQVMTSCGCTDGVTPFSEPSTVYSLQHLPKSHASQT